MATTYTVKKGDTLSQIASKYASSIKGSTLNAKIKTLCSINGIKDPDYIIVGQTIKFSGSAYEEPNNKTSKPKINLFGLQSNTDRTVYVTWTWSKSHTEKYQFKWSYDTGNGVWFTGDKGTTDDGNDKQSIYTAPSNATRVKFVVKAISTKRKVNGKETSYWTSDWSTSKIYTFKEPVAETPAIPDVEIEQYKLTAKLDNLDSNVTHVIFQVIKDNATLFHTAKVKVSTTHAACSCTIDAGSEYKVRCRAQNATGWSEWSEYSDNKSTIPSAVSKITICRANSDKSVYLEWNAVKTAKSYRVEYTTKKEYFDGSNAISSADGIEFNHYEIVGLETGQEYFFRVRAVNDVGVSAWSKIKSVSVGKKPAAPTTWSSTTTVTTGEPLTLYWMHNSEDGSTQTYAELELSINGKTINRDFAKGTHTVDVLIGGVTTKLTVEIATDENDNDKTSRCVVNTKPFVEGTKFLWRVRTAGITKTYGDWSMQRTVDVHAPPTLELTMTDSGGNHIDILTGFPFYIRGLAGPNTQTPIGYNVSIVSNDTYETVDQIGNVKMVSQGDQVYSKHFDISDALFIEMSAGNVDLENNANYTIKCIVAMSSGLTAESSVDFEVAWTDLEYEPNAEIFVDEDTLAAHIMPYCEDEIDGITLAVYRREFDGGFTEIATGIPNNSNTFVTDPHPSLDYARYRIVATDNTTGAVSYYDVPGYPIGEKGAVIQWAEEWSNFDATEEEEQEQPAWSGSMLKLMYNVDVSDSSRVDVALVEYIGRAHPISYYGTQLGTVSNWSMEIPKDDIETLYALRRLSIWKGDVYVREPSGSGYWANISVSFRQKHCEVTIPVSLDITRVEGGI